MLFSLLPLSYQRRLRHPFSKKIYGRRDLQQTGAAGRELAGEGGGGHP